MTKNWRNVSGKLLTAPDGTDWPAEEDRELEEGQESSLLAYGNIAEIRTNGKSTDKSQATPTPPVQRDPVPVATPAKEGA